MIELITLELPEALATSAHEIATRTNQPLETVLLQWLERAAADIPLESLPDDQILMLCAMQLAQDLQETLSELLALKRTSRLDRAQQACVDELMSAYRTGMMRKARALRVAAERGLLPPLG